jgi:Protein of unknown function (DUF3326)
LGLNLTDYILTDAPLNVEIRTSETGASWGTIGNLDSLLRAAETLITQARAEAIAVVARFPDETGEALQNYRYGKGVDPIAGAEAVISHAIVRQFRIPAAHAPALSPLPIDPNLSPRAAAEELGYTFLPCVLVGLSRAPKFVLPSSENPGHSNAIWADCVDAIIAPATACGGSAILSLSQSAAQIIAVQDNQTTVQVPPEPLGIQAIRVYSYLEALGVLAAHRSGVSHAALGPHLPSFNCISNSCGKSHSQSARH